MKIKHLSLSLVLAGLFFFATQPAAALVELRAGYGLLTSDDSKNSQSDSVGGVTADVMISPPAIGLAFGLRYESLSDKDEGIEVTYERISAQLAYTALDLAILRLDLVGGVGLSEKIKGGGMVLDDGRAFNVGVLGSIGLGLVSLNAEVGYHFGKVKGSGIEYDSDGLYTKFLIGFGI